MLCGSLAFASMGTLAHKLGGYCDWQTIALARSVFPLALVTALALAAGVRLVFWKPRILWMRSIAGSVSLVCTFYCLTRMQVSDVFTLTNMFPIWVALLSWPVLKEKPSAGVWLAVASGVTGVILIEQPHFAKGEFTALVALGSSLSTAVAMLGLHRLRRIDVRAIVVHFSAVSLMFSSAALFLFERPELPGPGLEGWHWMLLLGVGVTATVGQVFLTKAFAAGPPAKVSVVGLTQIVFAMTLDVALFGRNFSRSTLAGMALVVAPTAWLLAKQAWQVDEGPPAQRAAPLRRSDCLQRAASRTD
jgi:drug/metabolite transporter (DMT)-like permease